MNPKLELRNGGISGHGIFATEPLLKDERLVVFGGHVMTLDQEQELPVQIRDYAHQIDDDLVIGITSVEEIQQVDHINHSCSPNTGFAGQIFLVAMRDIKSNEEITFDYAMVLSGSDYETYKMDCQCGSDLCRGVITDADWKNPALQERYAGYFQYYLNRKISGLSAPA